MNRKSGFLKRRDTLRYVLWAMMAQTAFANRRYYRMATTWLPHLLTNSLSLLLPDVTRRLFSPRHKPRNIVEDTLVTMVRDNADYVIYTAPLALGYIVSHPRFNIYKGDLAKLRVHGVGLDAIPHTATAFALTALIADTLDTMGDRETHKGALADFVRWGDRHSALVASTILALITLIWEYGEYQMHEYEMSQKGSADAINMQWSVEDTIVDICSNFTGCVAALLWHRHKRHRRGR